MKEREIFLPPTWCSSLCKNSMSQVCVEDCAVKRDTSWFELKHGINMENIPRYPIEETKEMTKEEKFTSVTVYLRKVVDHLKGVDDGEDLYYPPGRRILADFKKQDVRLGEEGEDTLREDWKECEDTRERLTSMD
jgi:hypothetical protein